MIANMVLHQAYVERSVIATQLWPHERRKRILLDQLAVGHRTNPGHPRHRLLEHVRYFPPIESVRELIQIALQVLYRKLVVRPYHRTLEQ